MKNLKDLKVVRISNEELSKIRGGGANCWVNGVPARYLGDCGTLLQCTEKCVEDYGDGCQGCWEVIQEA
jgi:hypothetical protein